MKSLAVRLDIDPCGEVGVKQHGMLLSRRISDTDSLRSERLQEG